MLKLVNENVGFLIVNCIFVFINKDLKIIEMKTPKVETKSFFQKLLEDKRAIRECIQKNGDLINLGIERDIKFATPVSYRSDR